MLTRSRAKASKQPVFIDDKWNDAYIQTKDEQIDAMLAADASGRRWDELEEENSANDSSDDDGDGDNADVWHSDSDESEDHEDDWLMRPGALTAPSLARQWLASDSWLQNVVWTLAVVTVAPILLYVSVPHHTETLWPLQSPRLAGTLLKVLLNVLTLLVVAMALYGASCSFKPLTLSAVTNWRQLQVEAPTECGERLLDGGKGLLVLGKEVLAVGLSSDAPMGRLDDSVWTLLMSIDGSVVRQLLLVVAGVLVTVTCFHRLWAKMLVLLLTGSVLVLNMMTELKMQQRAAVEIFSLDPTFAFVNESIFVAIDGQNLEDGGSVAWAPYWGGVQQKKAQLCSKHYPQQLSNGGVLTTFGHVNEYIPCYLSAMETAAAVIVDGEIQPSEAFQCFEDIRLRVKDQKSVPGWSLTQHEQEAIPTEKQEL